MTLKRMTSLLAVLALLALVAVPAAADAENQKYEEKFQKVEKLAVDGKVYLRNISGNVKVLTWDKDEVKIDALKISKAGSLEEAKKNAALVKIEVGRNDGRLEILTDYPDNQPRHNHMNVSVNYDLTIPAKAEVEVRNVSGDVSAENIGGYAKLETVSGDVKLRKAAKGGVFTTVSGDVELSDISGDLRTKAVSGDITITRMAGTVDAETVSGNVELKGLTGAKSIEINVLSGDVIFDGVQKGRPLQFSKPQRRRHPLSSREVGLRILLQELQRRHRLRLRDDRQDDRRPQAQKERHPRRGQRRRRRPDHYHLQRRHRAEKALIPPE